MTAYEQAQIWGAVTTGALTLIPLVVLLIGAFIRQEIGKLSTLSRSNQSKMQEISNRIENVQSSIDDSSKKGDA